ncbi:Ig-like domain-containing protein [Roseomonas sp. GCM10028921]
MATFDNVQTAAQWGGYWGTSGRDQLVGTNSAEQFAAGDGNDAISAGGGDDRAYAGNGDDTVSGGTGNDYITGDAGCDVLAGDEGADTLYGGDGNDTLRGGASDGDVVNGGSGADTYIYGVGDGRDVVEGLNRWEGDKVDLRYYAAKLNGITSLEGLKAAGMVVGTQQWGGDTLIKFSDTDILTIRWVNPRDLTNDMFVFAKPPTDVQITKSTVDENSAARTAVGELSASDPDAKDTFSYKLLAGNDAFEIAADGKTLLTKQSFNFEAKSAHSVTVQVTDQWGLSFEKVLTIAVGNVNEAPTGFIVLKGEPKVGETLEADVSGINDDDGLGALTIQWQRLNDNGNWVEIQGGTGSTYTLTQADAATSVRSVVSYVDKGGTAETVLSGPTARVVTPSITPPDAKVITFESLQLADGQEAPIADGFEGLNWTQAGVYNPDGSTGYTAIGNMLSFVGEMDGSNRPGYEGEPRSPLTITRQGGGDFSVFGADFSAPFKDNQVITVKAWDDGVLVGEVTVKADRFFADHYNFLDGAGQRFTSVDRVAFGSETYFGLDNLAVRFTNEAPVAGADTARVFEDSSLTIDVLHNDYDPDVQALTITAVSASKLGAGVSIVDGKVQYDASALDSLRANQEVEDVLTYKVSDGRTETDSELKVTVTGVNDVPVAFQTADKVMNEDTSYTLKVSDFGFQDVDQGSALAAVSISAVANGTLKYNAGVSAGGLFTVADIQAGKLTWTPTANLSGDNVSMFAYHVSDGTAASQNSVVMRADIADVAEPARLVPNGGFENGTSGWNALGSVTSVTEFTYGSSTHQEREGTHFALLQSNGATSSQVATFLGVAEKEIDKAGDSDAITGSAVKQLVHLGAGQTLKFDWNFQGGDYMPFDDFSFFLTLNGKVQELADISDVGNYASSGWKTSMLTVHSEGNYLIGFGVVNAADSVNPSHLMIDNVSVI